MKARALAAGLALTLALPPAAGAYDREGFKRDIAWIASASVVDYASTRYAFERCGTCYEGNPWMAQSMAVKKAAATGALVVILWIARKFGSDKAATVTRWFIVAVWGVAAVWNTSMGVRGGEGRR